MHAIRRDVFQAIADPTRRDIINLVSANPMNLNSIAQNFDVSRPAISQHIKILVECGLIEITQQGRERYCKARLEPLEGVADWVEKYRRSWQKKHDRLDKLLGKMKNKKK